MLWKSQGGDKKSGISGHVSCTWRNGHPERKCGLEMALEWLKGKKSLFFCSGPGPRRLLLLSGRILWHGYLLQARWFAQPCVGGTTMLYKNA